VEHAGDDTAARALYDRCRQAGPPRPGVVLGLTALNRKEGRPEDARRLLAEAVAARPITPDLPEPWAEVYQEHAVTLAEDGRPGDAALVIDALIEAGAGDPGMLYYNLAGLHEAAGNLPESRRALERAIEKAPRRALYLERMADLLVKEGRELDLALDCLVSANDIDTNASSGAVAEAARGARISPHRERYLYKMARIYFLKGEDREAERLITTALALSREEPVTRALEALRQEIRDAARADSSG
jgi:tetratricopeptide (TPR) repeat protein